jgi:hypothetical protein
MAKQTVNVESVMTAKDFDQVWDFLEQKFGYSKAWRIKCHTYVYERQRLISYKPDPVWDFIFFCRFYIEPLLNAALCRNEHHPTVMSLLRWMFKDRLDPTNNSE